MMSGVGPFVIPTVLKNNYTNIVFANDLNPNSFKFLNNNVKLNHCQSNVITYNMDGKIFWKELTKNKTQIVKKINQKQIEIKTMLKEKLSMQKNKNKNKNKTKKKNNNSINNNNNNNKNKSNENTDYNSNSNDNSNSNSNINNNNNKSNTQNINGTNKNIDNSNSSESKLDELENKEDDSSSNSSSTSCCSRFINHVIMNLPAIAIEFLDTFTNTYNIDEINKYGLPMIHCYCFAFADKHVESINERLIKFLGVLPTKVDDELNIRWVRNVAPYKDMYCVSFRLPQSVALGVFEKGKECQTKDKNDAPLNVDSSVDNDAKMDATNNKNDEKNKEHIDDSAPPAKKKRRVMASS